MNESTYTRADLIEDVAANTGLGKGNSEIAVKATISAIVAAVQRGQKVQIKEFLTIETKDAAERQGRNPKTGEPITIPAHKRVVAKAKFEAQ